MNLVAIEKPHAPAPPEPSPATAATPIRFTPEDIYYEGTSGKYLVDTGKYFRTITKRGPVHLGLTRHFLGLVADEKEAREAATAALDSAELDRHVEWAGNLAGHRKGLIHAADGRPLLVLSSPPCVEPVRTSASALLVSILHAAFPERTHRDLFLGWVANAYKAVRAGIHCPQPMLVLAGEPGAGKSLLAYIVSQLLGGRVADPRVIWSGETLWNDHLCGAELLLLDDSSSTTDIRSRLNFGANFKASIYGAGVQMHKRHTSTTTVRPVWNLMVCCNNTPENLLVIPPINSDMADKVAVLAVKTIGLPFDPSGGEGRKRLQEEIRAELPGFASFLERFVIPENLRDPRGRGILAWRDPELMAAFETTRPERQLEEILEVSLTRAPHLWTDLPRPFTAMEIKSRLEDRDCPAREQAKELLKWPGACGTYLARLADGGSRFIAKGDYDGHAKRNRFVISRG